MKKIMPLPPRVNEVNNLTKDIWRFLIFLDFVLLLFLFIATFHIGYFYIYSLFFNVSESVSVKYAIYVVIGSFFWLVVYSEQIKKKWGYREDIEYISERINLKNKKFLK